MTKEHPGLDIRVSNYFRRGVVVAFRIPSFSIHLNTPPGLYLNKAWFSNIAATCTLTSVDYSPLVPMSRCDGPRANNTERLPHYGNLDLVKIRNRNWSEL